MSLTAEQQAIRATGIGASEIASIVGLNPWRSAHDVWLIKRGLVTEQGNVRTRMGQRVEACVLEEYTAETGAKLTFPGTVRHPDNEWMLCTPDGYVDGQRVVEVKCVGWRSAGHWGDDEDAIPDYYRPQCEWQMAVMGVAECHLAAWIGGSDFRIYTVRRNETLASALIEAGRAFWFDRVIGGEPPAVDGSDGARRMLAELYPRSTKPLLKATPEHDELADLLARARVAYDEAEASKKAAENRLIEAIGDADGIGGNGWKVTYRTSEKTGRRSLRFTAPETKTNTNRAA
jgi:putative phage-type endonuclease